MRILFFLERYPIERHRHSEQLPNPCYYWIYERRSRHPIEVRGSVVEVSISVRTAGMGIKETMRAVKARLGARTAFVELTVGAELKAPLEITDSIFAFPYIPVGNAGPCFSMHEFIKHVGKDPSVESLDAMIEHGRPFDPVTATVYLDVPEDQAYAALYGHLPTTAAVRSLISLFTTGAVNPVGRVYFGPKQTIAKQVDQSHRGAVRMPGDPIDPAFIRACAVDHEEDERLHFFLSLLNQAHSTMDLPLRIARYYILLESMAGKVIGTFDREEKAKGSNRPTSRDAIRLMLGYFQTQDVPEFQEGCRILSFDHIELAGRLRHKLFHGGGRLNDDDVPKSLLSARDFLYERSDMIAYILKIDCEREIAAWVTGQSIAARSHAGEVFRQVPRDSNYDGSKLFKTIVSSQPGAGEAIASVGRVIVS